MASSAGFSFGRGESGGFLHGGLKVEMSQDATYQRGGLGLYSYHTPP